MIRVRIASHLRLFQKTGSSGRHSVTLGDQIGFDWALGRLFILCSPLKMSCNLV